MEKGEDRAEGEPDVQGLECQAQKGGSSPWVENSSGGEATDRRVGNEVIRHSERKAVRFGG